MGVFSRVGSSCESSFIYLPACLPALCVSLSLGVCVFVDRWSGRSMGSLAY